MNKFICITIFFLLMVITKPVAQYKPISKKELKELYGMMNGSFSSKLQSIKDSTYFDINLYMMPVLKKRNDGYWFYVEQSAAATPTKPYRQRIYHLFIADDSSIISKVYEIKQPALYIEGWKQTGKLKNLSVDSLIERQGCSMYLRKQNNGNYSGATQYKQCLSSLRGAAYATSEVIIEPARLLSWDRGWDKNDKQVWGAISSGYTFIKQ